MKYSRFIFDVMCLLLIGGTLKLILYSGYNEEADLIRIRKKICLHEDSLVIRAFVCLMQNTSVPKVENKMFVEDVLRRDQGMAKKDFKDFYDLANGSVENIVCEFIQFLHTSESGLKVLYKPNGLFGKPEWTGQWKVLNMGSSSYLSSDCNQ